MYLLWISCNFSFKLSNGQCNNKTFKDTSQCHKVVFCFCFFFSLLRRKTTVSDAAAAAAKLLQSCPILCDPIDSSPSGSPIPGILQARTLEWVAISFSNAWKWKVKVKSLSHVRLIATSWTAAYEDPPSMGFSRQEYWSGVPLPSPVPDVKSKLIYLKSLHKEGIHPVI